ncbi:MAG: hypothetical protein OEZ45_13680 [Candidatus Aminicenantes bacterium]|nr:hypothetical protein [Candidatus Aminicenantes bacterium]
MIKISSSKSSSKISDSYPCLSTKVVSLKQDGKGSSGNEKHQHRQPFWTGFSKSKNARRNILWNGLHMDRLCLDNLKATGGWGDERLQESKAWRIL